MTLRTLTSLTVLLIRLQIYVFILERYTNFFDWLIDWLIVWSDHWYRVVRSPQSLSRYLEKSHRAKYYKEASPKTVNAIHIRHFFSMQDTPFYYFKKPNTAVQHLLNRLCGPENNSISVLEWWYSTCGEWDKVRGACVIVCAVKTPKPLKNRDFVTQRVWLDLGREMMIFNHSVNHTVFIHSFNSGKKWPIWQIKQKTVDKDIDRSQYVYAHRN